MTEEEGYKIFVTIIIVTMNIKVIDISSKLETREIIEVSILRRTYFQNRI